MHHEQLEEDLKQKNIQLENMQSELVEAAIEIVELKDKLSVYENGDVVIGNTFSVNCTDERGIVRKMFQPIHEDKTWRIIVIEEFSEVKPEGNIANLPQETKDVMSETFKALSGDDSVKITREDTIKALFAMKHDRLFKLADSTDENNEKNLVVLSRWLMGYVMELHDFRNNLFKHFRDGTFEDLKDEIKGTFPMLQGSANQRRFKRLGINASDNESIKKAVKHIEDITVIEEK